MGVCDERVFEPSRGAIVVEGTWVIAVPSLALVALLSVFLDLGNDTILEK